MMFLTMALGFFRSKAGLYVLIGVAVLGALWLLHHDGYVRGAKHEHVAMQKKLDVAALNLSTCKANGLTLQTAIDRQNAALTAIQQVGDAKLAQAEKAAHEALSVAEKARKSRDAILGKKLVGANECERAKEVDAAFLGELK